MLAFQSARVLLERFLANNQGAPPLEGSANRVCAKVGDAFGGSLQSPYLLVFEPWAHVGVNPHGEAVVASASVAALARAIADVDTRISPLWSDGISPASHHECAQALGVVLEGGDPSVFDPTTFAGAAYEPAALVAFCEQLLLRRWQWGGPLIGICLGHQLIAAALLDLVRRAVKAASAPDAPGALRTAAARIAELGDTLAVRKRDGREVARGWQAPRFSVSRNELPELGAVTLRPYVSALASGAPRALIESHQEIADSLSGVIDVRLAAQQRLTIAMFHGDEVNETAMLFVNWSLQALSAAVSQHRDELAVGERRWMLELPFAVEILASTWCDGEPLTECAAMAISYRDHVSGQIRRSYSVQFHPELQSDLRDANKRPLPVYDELRQDDGARLLARLLCEH
ncbi:MAG: hypothetical protein K0U93_27820 [Gammaproteobacteria bacterium]|nr:hypothetical protein [Gammaproteobacteria bacterium]